MKLQIDTDNLIIRIEEKVKLKDFIETLEKLLPGGDWEMFTLETNVTINWTNPIQIYDMKPYIPLDNPVNPVNPIIPQWEPYKQPWYTTCCDGHSSSEIINKNSGTYNIDWNRY